MYFVKFIIVILTTIIADIAWAYYFIRIEERNSVSAGFWASATILAGAFVTVNYVNDNTLLIAALIGSFIGTWGTVEWNKRKENKKE